MNKTPSPIANGPSQGSLIQEKQMETFISKDGKKKHQLGLSPLAA